MCTHASPGPQGNSWRCRSRGAMSCHYSWPQRDIPAFSRCSGTKTYFRLFLLLNPTLSPVKELLTPRPSCFAGLRMWPNDCSCQGNLFGMHANSSSPNSLSSASLPWPASDDHNPFKYSHCSAAPMETHSELLWLIPKNDVFNTDCSF